MTDKTNNIKLNNKQFLLSYSTKLDLEHSSNQNSIQTWCITVPKWVQYSVSNKNEMVFIIFPQLLTRFFSQGKPCKHTI